MHWILLACSLALGEESLASSRDDNLVKVISTLEDLQKSIDTESANMESETVARKTWCDDTLQEKKQQISEAESFLEDSKLEMEEKKSMVEEAKQNYEDLKGRLVAADASTAELEKGVDDKKTAHKNEISILDEAIARAEDGASEQESTTNIALTNLRSLEAQLPTSFLQLRQASLPATLPESVEELQKLKEEANKEFKEEHERHNDLIVEARNVAKGLTEDMAQAQVTTASAEEAVATLQRKMTAAERTASRETSLVGEIESQCQSSAEFDKRQDEFRVQQTAALVKALEGLKQLTGASFAQILKIPTFVQLGLSMESMVGFKAAGTVTQKAVSSVSSPDLDPITNIKMKLQGMVESLKAAANAEKGEDGFCSTEQKQTREKLRKKALDVDSYLAEARAHSALHAEQTARRDISLEEVGHLSELKATIELEGSKIKKTLETQKTEHQTAIEVLARAIQVVGEAYNVALLQITDEQQPAFVQTTTKDAQASSVVAELRTCSSALTSQINDADSYLSGLEVTHQNYINSLSSTVRAKEQEHNEADVAATEEADRVSSAEDSVRTAKAEIVSLTTYREELNKRCGPQLGNSYEELKKAREEEINGLVSALKVLEGEEVPV